MNVLVTGGAGYVGSAVTEAILKNGYGVVVIDNLQQGHQEAVSSNAEFILADIGDSAALDSIFQRYNITAVMHMAAETVVEYSMTDPWRFFQNNVVNGLVLLNAMLKEDIRKIIFSSSAAVYGHPVTTPIKENHPKKPLNAYGDSKLMFEAILHWYCQAYGLQYVSLRYFNAAGATDLSIEDHHPETHLIPNILKAAIDKSKNVNVFGIDYPTKDGSCIRDYIHVADVAKAHLLALENLDNLKSKVYNLGSGNGYSVLDVIETAKRVTSCDMNVQYAERRAGDAIELVASSNLAKIEMGWVPEYGLNAIIESAWEGMLRLKDRYESKEH